MDSKSVKSMVIAGAVKLGDHHFTFEDEEMLEPAETSGEMLPEGTDIEEIIPEQHEQEPLIVGRNYRDCSE